MVRYLEARLRTARRSLFVGREEELTAFRTALSAGTPPFSVLYVYGLGGVGKTSLLRAYEELCRERQVPVYYVDMRSVGPMPEAFLSALERRCGCAPGEAVEEALSNQSERPVLLIDTLEALPAFDAWLRERFLPGLPANVLVVLATREAPARAWRVDAGWRSLIHVLPLRNLDAAASRDLLRRRAVPEEQHEAVLSFTHGHPLAMGLVADLLEQQPGTTFRPHDAQNVVREILEQLVQHVPGPAHRAALEACAQVRFVTEGLLQAMLEMPDVFDLFTWLRGLSLVEAGPRGLVLHDLARDVLAADLRWRNPEWHAELRSRAHRYYMGRLNGATTDTDREILSDYTFLHRDHPLLRTPITRLQSQWKEAGSITPEPAREGDFPLLTAMVRKHEGEAAARLAEYWFDRQPEGARVFRGAGREVLGFELMLRLDTLSSSERAFDPAVERASAHLRAHAPLRKGERAVMSRFWMDGSSYQEVSPVQSLIVLGHVRCYLNTPGLAFSFLPCRNPERWETIFSFAAQQRIPKADFEVGGHSYAVFGHDWRAMPPSAWLDMLAGLLFGPGPVSEPRASTAEPVVVLDEPSFTEAVREAFRSFVRPETLYDSPLLHARIVVDRAGLDADPADRIDTLRTVLREAADSVRAHPREARYFRALQRTYLEPAPTQEKAAELLDLPFSTYRRHLKKAIDCAVDVLWQKELGNL